MRRHIYTMSAVVVTSTRAAAMSSSCSFLRDLRWPDPFPPRSVLAAAETDFSPSFVKEPEEERGGGGGMEVPASYVPLPRLPPPPLFPGLLCRRALLG